jgi:hypothetical protein
MSSQADIIDVREEVARIGEQIYELRLRALLEPHHDGRIVAIHLPSQEFFLGESLLEVSDRLREKYPGAGRGEIYSRGVGQRAVIKARTPRVRGEPS